MRITTRISGKRTAKAQFDAAAYAGLLAEALPTVITTVAQNKRMLKIFDKLNAFFDFLVDFFGLSVSSGGPQGQ